MNNKIIFLSAVLFSAVVSAQVKIGGTDGTPNSSAMLDVQSTNKGVLLPRIALSSTTVSTPLAAHVAGMTVYNTATAGDVIPGQYYNDGTKWNRIANTTDIPPVAANITASNGLTKTGNDIALGGSLDASTTISTTATRDLTLATTAAGTTGKLKITGLAATTATQLLTDKVIVQDAAGVLKTANVSDFAKSKNTTVFKAYKPVGSWALIALAGGWAGVPLASADQLIGDTNLLSGGNYVVPSDGIYHIKYEFRMQGVNASLLGSSFLGLIKNGNATPIDQKPLDAVNLSLNLGIVNLNLASVPITATTFSTVLELEEDDTIGFAINTGIDLGVASNKQVSIYIYKISDL